MTRVKLTMMVKLTARTAAVSKSHLAYNYANTQEVDRDSYWSPPSMSLPCSRGTKPFSSDMGPSHPQAKIKNGCLTHGSGEHIGEMSQRPFAVYLTISLVLVFHCFMVLPWMYPERTDYHFTSITDGIKGSDIITEFGRPSMSPPPCFRNIPLIWRVQLLNPLVSCLR